MDHFSCGRRVGIRAGRAPCAWCRAIADLAHARARPAARGWSSTRLDELDRFVSSLAPTGEGLSHLLVQRAPVSAAIAPSVVCAALRPRRKSLSL